MEITDYKLGLLVYKCQLRAAPSYLTDEHGEPADFVAWYRLHSTLSSLLVIHRTWWSTVGDWAFLAAAAHIWNSMSHPHSHCQSSAVASRHISSDAVFRDYVVVPEKWHHHFQTPESFFLLTFLRIQPPSWDGGV